MTDSITLALLLPEIILVVAATLIYIAGAFGLPQRAATWFALGGLADCRGCVVRPIQCDR